MSHQPSDTEGNVPGGSPKTAPGGRVTSNSPGGDIWRKSNRLVVGGGSAKSTPFNLANRVVPGAGPSGPMPIVSAASRRRPASLPPYAEICSQLTTLIKGINKN